MPSIGLSLLTEAVLYKFSAFENSTINRGGYINDDRLVSVNIFCEVVF